MQVSSNAVRSVRKGLLRFARQGRAKVRIVGDTKQGYSLAVDKSARETVIVSTSRRTRRECERLARAKTLRSPVVRTIKLA